jgi:uncharacterized membrane protein YraQ (UPF0718 family)
MLSRWVFPQERVQTYGDKPCAIQPSAPVPINENWLAALRGTSITLGRNLAYIVIRTVPLMLLAGVLGAVVVHLMPLTSLLENEPGVLSVTIVALVGIFLPVPVAFDVVLVAVLISAGAPMIYSMTLLFTLGIFSVYPFFIVSKTISVRVAVVLTAVLVVIGVIGGFVANEIHQAELQDMLQYLQQEN